MEINNEVGSISQGDNELIMSSDFESCEKDDELTQIEKHNESAYSDEDEFESEITVQGEDDGLENVEILDEIRRDVAVGMTNVEIEPSLSDMSEMKLVEEFARRGCGCQLISGEQCCKWFSIEYIQEVRSHCLSLTHDELDMVILGQIMATSNSISSVVTTSRHVNKKRERQHNHYIHSGQRICRVMFRFFHTVGKKRHNNLLASLKKNGLIPRIHGNTNRVPHNALSLSSVEYFVKFLLNYADENAILLPGRIPGYHKTDIKLLPSSVSKRSIWQLYSESAASVDYIKPVAHSTFNKLWQSLLPSIVLMKPMSDLCWTCQQNSSAILRATNKPESVKTASIEEAQKHLFLVQLERSYYKTICDSCRLQITSRFK